MSEQELRDRLHASVDAIEPPADLAARAERGWRRRRRTTVAGASLAVLAVVGGVVAALPRSAPAPVVAGPAHVEEGCVELPAPAAARPAADLSGWTYQGDPALRAKVAAVAPAAVPLLGSRTASETAPGTFAYAVALRQPTGWHVRIGAAAEQDGQVLTLDSVLLPLPASG
ncbi:MAG TPA: hypothetical protein VLM05_12470, partial [Mycobacteriales bacterium]|nr:hypothetical protein [Mycobacteriales bacterium]